jgi:6-phosphogluconolactonase (cycloisomerase 2 family)
MKVDFLRRNQKVTLLFEYRAAGEKGFAAAYSTAKDRLTHCRSQRIIGRTTEYIKGSEGEE